MTTTILTESDIEAAFEEYYDTPEAAERLTYLEVAGREKMLKDMLLASFSYGALYGLRFGSEAVDRLTALTERMLIPKNSVPEGPLTHHLVGIPNRKDGDYLWSVMTKDYQPTWWAKRHKEHPGIVVFEITEAESHRSFSELAAKYGPRIQGR